MLRKIVNKLFSNPTVFNIVRRILENNFQGEKRAIRRELGKNHGLILDIPCGTGEFSVMFNKDQYIGVDLSDDYIKSAKKNYKRKFMVMNSKNLKFKNKYFNSVLIIGFFHHLNRDDIHSTLREVKRVLKDDGKVLLIEDAPTKSKWNIIGKLVQKFDLGANIRKSKEYFGILSEYFKVERGYPIRSGVCDYSVFVMKK